MYNSQFSIQKLYIIGGLLLLVLCIVSLFLFYLQEQTNPVMISKVPQDAKLFIDGKEVRGSSTNIPNGTYEVRGEKEGFSTSAETVIVDDFNKQIIVSLVPESEEAIKWSEQNEHLYLAQEELYSQRSANSEESMLTTNPIITKLPINGFTYKVGYARDTSDTSGRSIVLTIQGDNGYRNAGVGAIYAAGYDPANFKVEFVDYTNPFEEEK